MLQYSCLVILTIIRTLAARGHGLNDEWACDTSPEQRFFIPQPRARYTKVNVTIEEAISIYWRRYWKKKHNEAHVGLTSAMLATMCK